MPTSTRFYSGQIDYIDKLNQTVDEIGGGGAVTTVTGTAPVVSSGGTTPAISMAAATTSVSGYLTNTNWNTFNGKANISDITATNLTGVVLGVNGGTGVNNSGKTITLGGNFVTSGAFASTFTMSGTTTVTFPTSGTLLSTAAAITVAQGGTGLATLTTGNVILGAGTGTPTFVAPSTNGNILTSNGTTWVSTTPAAGGTVTTVSVASTNGFAGTVATATTTPSITLTTSVTGLIKGNGTALSAATAGTDYSLGTSALATGIIKSTTSTGAFTIAVAGDFPTLNQNTTGTASNVTGVVSAANGGTGVVNTGTVTLGGNLTTSGAFASTFTMTGATGVTFPTSGTLLSTAAAVTVAQGGTGLATLTTGNVLLGAGTGTPTFVAPSTNGNVLTSNGTTWISSPASGGSAITVKDEGSNLTTSLTSLDFVGAGVSASNTGGAVTVTITGGGGSGGTVTSASVVSANGFTGAVATATTTPAITLTTSVTGLIKGDGTALLAATAGTDYSVGTNALSTGIIKSTTTTGALTIAVAGDFPTLNQDTTGTAANVTGIVSGANGGTGVANTSKTITLGGNLTTSGAFASTFTMTGTTSVNFPTGGNLISTTSADFSGNAISGIKSASLSAPETITTTTGTINLDLSTGVLKNQNEPTGAITYTFTAPPAYTKFQILIASDGTSSAFGFTFPTAKWYGATFTTTTANKGAIINGYYDGTNYHMFGASEV